MCKLVRVTLSCIKYYLFLFLLNASNIAHLFNTNCFFFLAPQQAPVDVTPVNPCIPSPCGPYSQCKNIGDSPSCSCRPEYTGTPPNCRPECSINSECPSNKACINEKCRDPCPGSCGISALCNVVYHTPACTCPEGYTGDPFTNCYPKPPPRKCIIIGISS